ncbi:AAA family ATPase [Companilactobacillus kimchii]|uniref:AAA family ATPase n=1 Tax=Companilactobacillus kimchii TaxID=2801452 RepID=UPI000704DBB2|nr:AAA family ATPase [Companilactobacillus kimchii]KAE9561308.1 NTP-binding protein [Companilactobacillus kimchii]GEO48485.1 NTP-binding protein [Companilactobacillus paralimentarius]
MTRYSYSRVDLWHKCPYHYKARYIDKLIEIPKLDANSPLILGHALHKGLESGEKAMEQDYFDSYPLITNDQVNEMMKLQILLPKVNDILDNFKDCKFQHEYPIITKDFIGFADLIITAPDGTSTVIDFKYSNHVENYLESGQLHLYKYYLEKLGFNIKHLGYIFIPKTGIKQKQTESLYQFRKRLTEEVSKSKPELVPIKYDDMNVLYFQNTIKEIEAATEYPKNVDHCFSCMPRFAPNYLNAIQDEKGEILMQLPKNVRRKKQMDLKPDIWLYADSYVGKTTFMDQFDDVLMLNTDGNTDNITSPVLPIQDEVKKEGRMTKRKLAWETFLEVVQTLEVSNTEHYQTIVIDLMEDLREACRTYIMDKFNWEHESDGNYGKGWSMVTKEFDNAIKRLKAVGLQIVYISRELRNDITLRNGSVRTTFQPNIDSKTANFLTGTVDITMRAYVNDSDEHLLMLQKQPNIFGGGRFNFKVKEVPLEKDAFIEALKDAQPKDAERPKTKPEQKPLQEQPESAEDTNEEDEPEKPTRRRRTKKTEEPTEEEKPKRKRRSRKAESEPEDEMTPPGEDDEPETTEEAPKPRRRRRRTARKED